MHMHASCASRDGHGVLLMGPAGVGKSDLLLRLLDRGFALVADDQVEVRDRMAWPPERLAGLLEVRGLGIIRLPYSAPVRLALAVRLDGGANPSERLPHPCLDPVLAIPVVRLAGSVASAPERVALALDCAVGRVSQLAGAFVD